MTIHTPSARTVRRGARRGATRVLLWVMSTLTVLVLLLGYRTSLAGPGAVSAGEVAPIVSSVSGVSTAPTTPGASGTTGSSGSSGTGTRTVTGPAVETRYGPVQVELTVSGSGSSTTITDVAVVQYPHSDGHDAQINGYALPILVQETVDAQSAQIDMVSGATYTSTGYLGSLQAAIDEAQA